MKINAEPTSKPIDNGFVGMYLKQAQPLPKIAHQEKGHSYMQITDIHAYRNPNAGTTVVMVELEIAEASMPVAVSSVLALFSSENHMKDASKSFIPPYSSRAEAAAFFGIPEEALKEVPANTPIPAIKTPLPAFNMAAMDIISAPVVPAAAEIAKEARTRRPRTNPDAAPAAPAAAPAPAEAPAAEAAPVEGRRRTRVTAEPVVPEVKVVTDNDLVKACSHAAGIIGPEVVKAVLADFHVKAVNELAADVREKFIGELQDEITLAQEEAAAAKA